MITAYCEGYQCCILGYLCADPLWQYTDTSALRPVFLQVAASNTSVRAIVASLRTGKTIEWGNSRKNKSRIELLKTAPYEWHVAKTSAGSVLTVFHGPFIKTEPGLVEEDVRYVSLPPDWWVQEHGDTALAMWASRQLDRRIRCPLIPGKRFAGLVVEHAASRGLIETADRSTRGNLYCRSDVIVGFGQFAIWKSTHQQAEQLVADCVQLYQQQTAEAA